MKYDTIVIGFGKCGKTIAPFLAKNGEKVALIEKDKSMYGGTCINVGCIPTKSLFKSSQIYLRMIKSLPDPAFYYKKAVEEKNNLVLSLRNASYEKLVYGSSVDFLEGSATFIDEHEIRLTRTNGEVEELEAGKIIVDVGSKDLIPPIKGLRNDHFVNSHVYYSDSISNLSVLPQRVVIIGSSYVGLEYANIFCNFGSDVTILSNETKFMPCEDAEVSSFVLDDFASRGIKWLKGTVIQNIDDDIVNFIDKKGNNKSIRADAILIATGRRPNIAGLGLENTNIKFNELGNVMVNEHLESSLKNVYFVGDCNGGPQFSLISLDDSRILKSHFSGDNSYTLNDRNSFPYTIYMTPSLSRIGLTEKEALRKKYEIMVATLLGSTILKAKVLGNPRGLLKAIIDKKTNLILGATLYCEESYEMINLIKMAMDNKIPYTYLRDNIYTHPTMSEALNDLFNNIRR